MEMDPPEQRVVRPLTMPHALSIVIPDPPMSSPSLPVKKVADSAAAPQAASPQGKKFHSDDFTHVVETLSNLNFEQKLADAKALADSALLGFLEDLRICRARIGIRSEQIDFLRRLGDLAKTVLRMTPQDLWYVAADYMILSV